MWHVMSVIDDVAGDGQSLGQDPSTGEDIFLKEGRYGLYVERGDARAGIPKNVPLDEVDLHTAVDLLQWPKVGLAAVFQGTCYTFECASAQVLVNV